MARALGALGYTVTRQTGSHLRLTTLETGQHHVTVPAHAALRLGTLAGILDDVARHFKTSRDAIAEKLFTK